MCISDGIYCLYAMLCTIRQCDWIDCRNPYHDDVIKWKHFPRNWPFVRGIHRSPVNSPHIGQWRRALMFSLICVWINGWVNNREAGDLRRYRAHYDVTVMSTLRHIHNMIVLCTLRSNQISRIHIIQNYVPVFFITSTRYEYCHEFKSLCACVCLCFFCSVISPVFFYYLMIFCQN